MERKAGGQKDTNPFLSKNEIQRTLYNAQEKKDRTQQLEEANYMWGMRTNMGGGGDPFRD